MSDQFKDSVDVINSLMEQTMTELRNTFIANNYSDSVMDDSIEKLRDIYNEKGIRIRVIPSSSKKKVTDKKGTNLICIDHPGDNVYSYTKDFSLTNGIPLRITKSGVIVCAINDEGIQELVPQDVVTCAKYSCKAQITKV